MSHATCQEKDSNTSQQRPVALRPLEAFIFFRLWPVIFSVRLFSLRLAGLKHSHLPLHEGETCLVFLPFAKIEWFQPPPGTVCQSCTSPNGCIPDGTRWSSPFQRIWNSLSECLLIYFLQFYANSLFTKSCIIFWLIPKLLIKRTIFLLNMNHPVELNSEFRDFCHLHDWEQCDTPMFICATWSKLHACWMKGEGFSKCCGNYNKVLINFLFKCVLSTFVFQFPRSPYIT